MGLDEKQTSANLHYLMWDHVDSKLNILRDLALFSFKHHGLDIDLPVEHLTKEILENLRATFNELRQKVN